MSDVELNTILHAPSKYPYRVVKRVHQDLHSILSLKKLFETRRDLASWRLVRNKCGYLNGFILTLNLHSYSHPHDPVWIMSDIERTIAREVDQARGYLENQDVIAEFAGRDVTEHAIMRFLF